MDFRYLGASGFKISEITYGNWLTHGSQVENDTATQCERAALDVGISTLDTADVYANTRAESVLGEALKGEAVGVLIPAELMGRIDAVLGDVVERYPAKTLESSPKTREA